MIKNAICAKCGKKVRIQPTAALDYWSLKCPWGTTYYTKTGKEKTKKCGYKEIIHDKKG